MHVPFDPGVRIHVGVVALGTPARLTACLESLVGHRSAHEFVVSCLVNPTTVSDEPLGLEAPDGVLVERCASNLGWAGGIHRLRALSRGEYLVWVQDDMTPVEGWLDALVAAAEAHPRVACFGAIRVDEHDQVLLYNGGFARPADDVAAWNETDTTAEVRPTEVTLLDWVTSKGCLTRTSVFDEVGGPDPRLWPLNHVDKDYSTHLRAHGWDVALVPGARLLHEGARSAPSAFRQFLGPWRDGWFEERWSPTVTALAGLTSGEVAHPCAEWKTVEVDAVEAAAGQAATRMLVPFTRHQASAVAELEQLVQAKDEEITRIRHRIRRLRARIHRLRARLR